MKFAKCFGRKYISADAEPPVKVGEKVYAVYNNIAILCHEVYAIGKSFFLFNPFTATNEDSWKWDFEDENKTWSKSLDTAKEILWEKVKKYLAAGADLEDLELVQCCEDYWEIRGKK